MPNIIYIYISVLYRQYLQVYIHIVSVWNTHSTCSCTLSTSVLQLSNSHVPTSHLAQAQSRLQAGSLHRAAYEHVGQHVGVACMQACMGKHGRPCMVVCIPVNISRNVYHAHALFFSYAFSQGFSRRLLPRFSMYVHNRCPLAFLCFSWAFPRSPQAFLRCFRLCLCHRWQHRWPFLGFFKLFLCHRPQHLCICVCMFIYIYIYTDSFFVSLALGFCPGCLCMVSVGFLLLSFAFPKLSQVALGFLLGFLKAFLCHRPQLLCIWVCMYAGAYIYICVYIYICRGTCRGRLQGKTVGSLRVSCGFQWISYGFPTVSYGLPMDFS